MSSDSPQSIKKISPLQAIVFTGTISILIVIAGTVGFLVMQHNLLKNVEKKQACYLELVDFRGKLIEFDLARTLQHSMRADGDERIITSKQSVVVLRLMYEKILNQMHDAGLQPVAPMHADRQNWAAVLSGENLDLFRFGLDNTIDKAKFESKAATDALVVINQFFLFFIIAVLLTLSITAGWLLHNNYRQTLLPLAQLSGQLKLLNKDLPESIHDTAEEIKKELTETEYSSDITQITESIMSFCDEIEEKNKKLDELHIRDEKTNLYNYRHFKEHLIIDIERARRHGDKVSLAMIDIDYFKKYNDTNGHIAGDHALKNIADLIISQCRISDVPARFGGDEFAVLLPETDSVTVREIAERLRKVVNAAQFQNKQQQPAIRLTVSIGVATFPGDAPDRETLINNADRALYMAKSRGRNNVVTFDSMNAQQSIAG
jgi:diguanylate cyclase (GGDEF)-like protein